MKSLDLVFIIGLYAHGLGKQMDSLSASRSSQMRKLAVNAGSFFQFLECISFCFICVG